MDTRNRLGILRLTTHLDSSAPEGTDQIYFEVNLQKAIDFFAVLLFTVLFACQLFTMHFNKTNNQKARLASK